MSPTAPYAVTPPHKLARDFGMVGAVVVLHLGVMGALQVGLGREPERAPPTVVVARLIEQADAAPQPMQHPPAPLLGKPAVAQPALASMSQAPAPEPAPVAPTLAAAGALPAVPTPASPAIAPTPSPTISPMAPVIAPATPAGVPGVSMGSSSAVVHPSALTQRVAATLPATRGCQKPPYPTLSERREEQGTVHLKFLIGADGRVLESHIEQSSGYARLDEAARVGLSLCQFKPATVDGKPEASWVIMPYTWRLE
jgi:periplasmic protein TonB